MPTAALPAEDLSSDDFFEDLADIISLDERRGAPEEEADEAGITPARGVAEWRERVEAEKLRMGYGAALADLEDLAPGYQRVPYPTAELVLTKYLLFGADDQFADLWWLQYGTREQQRRAREAAQWDDGTPVLGARSALSYGRTWFRVGKYVDTRRRSTGKQAGWAARPRNCIPIDRADAVFTRLGLKLCNVDPRAFIARPLDPNKARKESRLKETAIRSWTRLPTHFGPNARTAAGIDVSGQPLTPFDQLCVVYDHTYTRYHDRMEVALSRLKRFYEVESQAHLQQHPALIDAHRQHS